MNRRIIQIVKRALSWAKSSELKNLPPIKLPVYLQKVWQTRQAIDMGAASNARHIKQFIKEHAHLESFELSNLEKFNDGGWYGEKGSYLGKTFYYFVRENLKLGSNYFDTALLLLTKHDTIEEDVS